MTYGPECCLVWQALHVLQLKLFVTLKNIAATYGTWTAPAHSQETGRERTLRESVEFRKL